MSNIVGGPIHFQALNGFEIPIHFMIQYHVQLIWINVSHLHHQIAQKYSEVMMIVFKFTGVCNHLHVKHSVA